jgi:DNA-binding response OmpR family regulator
MLLFLSAGWPERALVRAQLEEETGQQVIGTDTVEAALDWLSTTRFALVILDTQGIAPDPRLLGALRSKQVPLFVLTGAFDRDQWQAAIADLNVRSVLTRPIRIGELTAAIRRGGLAS